MVTLPELANWAQVISVLLSIISIVVTVVLSYRLYQRGKQKRALSCIFGPVISPIEITASDTLRSEVEIRYKGEPIERLFVARARLKNTGNMEIRKSDVVEPITFTFGPETELIREPQVIATYPENLKVGWNFAPSESTSRPNVVSLEFDLLNPGEEIAAEFVYTGQRLVPDVECRIAGISAIQLIDPSDTPRQLRLFPNTRLVFLIFVLYLVSYLVWNSAALVGITVDPVSYAIGIAAAGLAGGVLFLIGDWWSAVTRPYPPYRSM